MKLKVAVDHDGTLIDNIEIYRELINTLREGEHEVTIITGRKPETRADDIQRLRKLEVESDWFLNTSRFNRWEKQLEQWSERGHISVDRDEIVCMWKARMCVEYEYDILIDDAADKIRLYADAKKCKTLILKSPTAFNQVFAKWGRDHILKYTAADGSDAEDVVSLDDDDLVPDLSDFDMAASHAERVETNQHVCTGRFRICENYPKMG